ncbi:unnamed protein product [Nezara viridula]|uniref:1-acylglycerol-3-phosphate O-acyltransferase n=1 Tax=Nezara viridula TaxID=85310 RepID=A0A9P0E9N1_NEZVI|nr:unnamed protein product [Nezara viridula]
MRNYSFSSQEMDLTTIALLCFIMYFLPIILPRHSRLRFYSCYTSYVTVTLTTCLILYPLQILLPSKAYRIPETVAELFSKVLGIEWEIRNQSILEKYKNTVIVINHQSMFDFLGSIMVFRPIIKYIPAVKKEIQYVFPLGQTMKLFNVAFIDRKNNPHLAKALLKEKFMDKEKNLIIYPEGTRNHYGEPFLPFKKGAFRIAVEFKRPIIPVVISPYYFIKPGKFTGGKIIISLLEPIDTVGLNETDINDLTERTRELMEKEYIKLKKEVMLNSEDDRTR